MEDKIGATCVEGAWIRRCDLRVFCTGTEISQENPISSENLRTALGEEGGPFASLSNPNANPNPNPNPNPSVWGSIQGLTLFFCGGDDEPLRPQILRSSLLPRA